ncbi:MAG: GDCCVxC domain-containing (seleno)protein [Pyrinomonadaceae bacterium]
MEADRGTVQERSVITCPECTFQQEAEMPTDACLFLYDCKGCGAVLKPRAGDCCVFCSYGSLRCPPEQLAELSPSGEPVSDQV